VGISPRGKQGPLVNVRKKSAEKNRKKGKGHGERRGSMNAMPSLRGQGGRDTKKPRKSGEWEAGQEGRRGERRRREKEGKIQKKGREWKEVEAL